MVTTREPARSVRSKARPACSWYAHRLDVFAANVMTLDGWITAGRRGTAGDSGPRKFT
jgi:hypothetical protein